MQYILRDIYRFQIFVIIIFLSAISRSLSSFILLYSRVHALDFLLKYRLRIQPQQSALIIMRFNYIPHRTFAAFLPTLRNIIRVASNISMITAELRGRIPYLERVIYAPHTPVYAISRHYREKTDYKIAVNPNPR